MDNGLLKEEERVSLTLRSLYKRYGYLPCKMSKFEEYDLYVRNKEFLVGDGVVTFRDTDGRLLALKPDVTLSIIKKDLDEGDKRKVYYDEKVYRISSKTKQFKEIRQVGLECLGDIGIYDVYETVLLAAASLEAISPDFRLCVSHLGLLSAILRRINGDENFVKESLSCLESRNAGAGLEVCKKYAVKEEKAGELLTLFQARGEMQGALAKLATLCESGEAKGAYEALRTLCALLQKGKYAKNILLDFSVCGDMGYYDDILFTGYIQGVGEGVLSGGRYDKLLTRMGKTSGAIGFAVYLDVLDGFTQERSETDVDALVLYDEKTNVFSLADEVERLTRSGKSVRAQKKKDGIRFGEIVDLTGGGVC